MISRRAYPPRKTEEERRATHEALYGEGAPLPERGYRFRTNSGSLGSDTTTLIALGGLLLVLFLVGRK